MRILQITDVHIGRQDEDTYGVDVRKNFLALMDAARQHRPDYLVLSGDLCYRDGEEEVYRWVKTHLDQLECPYFVISGNHDDPAMLARAFGLEKKLVENTLFFEETLGGMPVFFLDTTVGTLSHTQRAWIQQKLADLQGPVLIFMHHPPITSGVPFMDNKYPLLDRDIVLDIFLQAKSDISVFSGHYHVEKTIRKANVVVHITPSSFFQMDQESSTFKVDHYRVGFREIEWTDGALKTTVHYLEGNRL